MGSLFYSTALTQTSITNLIPALIHQTVLGSNLGPVGNFSFGNLPTGQGPIQLYDTKGNWGVNLFVVTDTDSPQAPLLVTDQGFIVKKDLAVGGNILSGQGAMIFGYGWTGSGSPTSPIAQSPPLIELLNSSTSVKSGPTLPSSGDMNGQPGQIFHNTSDNKLYIWSGQYGSPPNTWKLSETDPTGKYDTLFLVKNNGYEPAHLDLGNLTVHGNLTIEDGTSTALRFSSTGGINYIQSSITQSSGSVAPIYFSGYNGTPTLATLGTSGSLQLNVTGAGSGVILTPSGYSPGAVMRITNVGVNHDLQFGTIINNSIRFLTNNVNTMTLDTSGSLGIAGSLKLAAGCVLSNDTNDTLRIASGAHSGQGSSVTIGAQNSSCIHFISNGGLPFWFNNDIYSTGHFIFDANGGIFSAWTSGGWQGGTPTYGIATNGDFYVNGNQVLAGGLQFNQGGTAAYLIWSNSYVLTVGATGGPFYYGAGHDYSGYFGAIDCGAVFTQIVNPIGSVHEVLIGGTLAVSSATSPQGSNSHAAKIGSFDLGVGNVRIQLGSYASTSPVFDILNYQWSAEIFKVDNSGNTVVAGSFTANSTYYGNGGGALSTVGINPVTTNTYGCGSGSNYWLGVCAYRLYAKDGTVHSFDALDDLALIKNYKTKTNLQGYEAIDIKASLPHLIADDEDKGEFIDISKAHGFAFGCIKALAKNDDHHNERIGELEAHIQELQSQIEALNLKMGVN